MAELQDRMSHTEYLEWRAFDRHEPIGDARGDYQTALLITVLASIYSDKKKSPPKISSFLPQWWTVSLSPMDLAAKFRALTADIGTQDSDDTP